jgi:NADPH2:quinone reductase
MTKAIVIRTHGGPGVLQIEDVAVGEPAAGELRVRQTAIGVNFHDCYVRSGLYKTLVLPGIPGIEGAGVVEAVGLGVTSFAPGDRIGYVTASYGGYAESRLLPAALAVKLPDDMLEDTAAAVFVKGLTAAFLVLRTHRILPGQTILVHAAAGGVGQLLCQWASHLGATVIGTVGSSERRPSPGSVAARTLSSTAKRTSCHALKRSPADVVWMWLMTL